MVTCHFAELATWVQETKKQLAVVDPCLPKPSYLVLKLAVLFACSIALVKRSIFIFKRKHKAAAISLLLR